MKRQQRSFFRSLRPFLRGTKLREQTRNRRAEFESLEQRSLLSAAPNPQMVADLSTAPLSSDPSQFVRAGKYTFFRANDGIHGDELWRSDGTPAGTRLVKDINPGNQTSFNTPDRAHISNLVQLNGVVFFSAYDPEHGTELWKTDGAEAGTKIVKDIQPGFESAIPTDLVVFKGSIIFAAYNPDQNASALWKTDGTAKGTKVVMASQPGSERVRGLTVRGDRFSFLASYQFRLTSWISDGTTAGTKPEFGPYYFTQLRGKDLYFRQNSDDYFALFRQNSSDSQLQRIERAVIRPGGHFLGGPIKVGQQVLFAVYNPGLGSQLWRTDGTAKGTHVIRVLASGNIGIFPEDSSAWTVANDKLYFRTYHQASGEELWVTDGTTAGTKLIRDINPGTENSRPTIVHTSGGIVFFFAYDGALNRQLWRTDGTTKGTLPVSNYNGMPIATPGIHREIVPESFLFATSDPVHGAEVWQSDGTARGTKLLKDINVWNSGSFLRKLTAVNDTLFFVSTAPTDTGYGLWKTNGSAADTVFVHEFRVDFDNDLELENAFLAVGNLLYYAQPDVARTGYELWKSDATPEGTVLVKHIPSASGSGRFPFQSGGSVQSASAGGVIIIGPGFNNSAGPIYNLTAVGDRVYFALFDGASAHGSELWTSDGTESGTHLVKDLQPGRNSSFPESLVKYNGTLYFRASTQAGNNALWKTNGTAEGTVLVKSFSPGQGIGGAGEIVVAGGKMYFGGYDSQTGNELWQSDGSTEGTKQVFDLTPGPDGTEIRQMTVAGDLVFFFQYNSNGNTAFWRTDGTTEGTFRVLPNAGPIFFSSGAPTIAVLDHGVVFAAYTGGLIRLWVSDGTTERTAVLAEVNVYYITTHDGKAYFQGYGNGDSSAVWESDGTPLGTRLVSDLQGANYFASVGDTLYFAASDGLHGIELWKLET